MTADIGPSTLHRLAVSLEVMERLLGRRTVDGTLVMAEPALIEAAIKAGREEVASVEAMLAEVPRDVADPWRGSLNSLVAAVATVAGLLDLLQEMLVLAGG